MNPLNTRLLLSLIAVLVLTILPLPSSISMLRPSWVLLLVLYIQCCLPKYFRVTWVLLLGLCLDALSSTVMGLHSFTLLLTTWIATGRSRGFIFYSTLQQMSVILLFCLLYQFIIYLIDAALGLTSNVFYVIGSSFLSVLIWPWLRFIFSSPMVVELKDRKFI
ncbi:MAG: rod shape-determining protein MreD [Legionellaceae bacterium]|nr:rod shape-determining protein MreD [Legionellaceae bacterium]